MIIMCTQCTNIHTHYHPCSLLYVDLVIKEVHGINDNDKQFILAYADDIAQTAATKEELEKWMTT